MNFRKTNSDSQRFAQVSVEGTDLDHTIKALGQRGRFTILQILLVWIGILPSAYQLLSNVFIGRDVPHLCACVSNESEYLEPFQAHDNVSVSYGQCAIQVLSGNQVVHTDTCINGMEYLQPRDKSFVSQFNLVCGYTNLARLTQTLVIGGQGCGAILGALLADRIGRKHAIVASNAGLLVFGLSIAYAANFTIFAVCKFFVGASQQSMLTVTATFMLEILASEDRRWAITLFGTFWSTGSTTLALVAFLLQDYPWRSVQMAFSLFSLPVVIHFLFLKESLRWLMANGKTLEAGAYMEHVIRINRRKPRDVLNELELKPLCTSEDSRQNGGADNSPKSPSSIQPTYGRKMTYLDIFRVRRLLINTLIMWIAWFTTALSYFALYITSSSLAGDLYLNFFLTALMEIPSNIFFYFFVDRCGRKFVIITMFLTVSVGLIGGGIFRSLPQTKTNSAFALISSMVGMAGASGAFGIIFSYTPELFPTNIRNQSLGISSMMGRIGGMLAPFTGVLSQQAMWAPGLLIGCLACLVAILLRFLPETNGRELPQTLEELQTWFKDDEVKIKENGGIEEDI